MTVQFIDSTSKAKPTTTKSADEDPIVLSNVTATYCDARRFRWSREKYLKLIQVDFFRGERVERINGEIIRISPMNEPHIRGILVTLETLRSVFATGFMIQPQLPLALGPLHDPEPDIAITPSGPRDPVPPIDELCLVVEIADSSLTYDTTVKAELYAGAAVPEYWVVDLMGRVVLVHREPAPLPNGRVVYRKIMTMTPGETIVPLRAPVGAPAVLVSELLP